MRYLSIRIQDYRGVTGDMIVAEIQKLHEMYFGCKILSIIPISMDVKVPGASQTNIVEIIFETAFEVV